METLEQKIVELYTRGGFGKAAKSEIDAAVFHHLLLKNLPDIEQGIAENGRVDYFRINKTHIHALSLALRITEASVTRLLENDYLFSRGEPPQEEASRVGAVLLGLLPKSGIRKENIKDGKLRLSVSNPIAKKILQVKIFEAGGIVDCSFSQDIVVIEVYDFLRLLNAADDGTIQKEIKALLDGGIKDEALSAAAEKFLKDLKSSSVGEQIKSIVKGSAGAFAANFLGEEGSKDALDLLKRLFDFAKEKTGLSGKPKRG
ncbi:MAG: hypothetical protein Pg6C_06170 [Treponemataceae bacterium]|nr:MAG: hypothetical protein Pg6C_06170 [Treponemataceae bacterium]